MWPNLQFPTEFVTFTEEILHGKLHFLCNVEENLTSMKLSLEPYLVIIGRPKIGKREKHLEKQGKLPIGK